MPRIAIVDDEEDYLKEISISINNFLFNQGISCKIDTFSRAELLIYEIKDNMCYDIYLLDIEMPNINGLELAKKVREYDKEGYLIFVTSHLQFLMKGYDFFAYQYIMKSALKQKLIPTIATLQKRMEIDKEKFYQICTNYRYEKILYRDLYYIYKESKNAIFVTKNGMIVIRETLKNIYKGLNKNEFILIDRGYIVNIVHIIKINSNIILLRNGDTLKISRTYTEKVKECIHSYWKEHLL